MIQPRHQASTIDLTKGIDGDSKITAIKEGFALDLINCRSDGGVLEKRTGYESVGNFPISCDCSGTTLTFKRSYYKTLGCGSYTATASNVATYLGISGVTYPGWYIHKFFEDLPSNAVLVVQGGNTPTPYLRLTDRLILTNMSYSSWDVFTAPTLPSHRLEQGDFTLANEGGFLSITAEGMPLNLYDLVCFNVPYFGTGSAQRGKVTAIVGDRFTTNISYVTVTNLPYLEFSYLPEKWIHIMPSTRSWITGITSPTELQLLSSVTVADTYVFGIMKDATATTHFMSVWEGNIVTGHNNRLYTLQPSTTTELAFPEVKSINGVMISYPATNRQITIPTSVLPNSNLFQNCLIQATYFDRKFTGTVISTTPTTTIIEIDQTYWDVYPATVFLVTYTTNLLPVINDVVDFDVLLINGKYHTIVNNVPTVTLDSAVNIPNNQIIYKLPRLTRHIYGDLNPLWAYGEDLALQTTAFSEGVYIQAIEGGVLRFNGKDVINLSKFTAPTLPLVRSVLGTHGSLEVQAEDTLKDGYAEEQQIIVTYYIEEWNGGSLESMITPNYDCITRPALNSDGSQYASWLELAVPTLPASVASMVGGKVKIRVYRRPATSKSTTICKLEVEVENDTTVPYIRVLIGDKFNFNQDEKKELYADVFRFSNIPAPRGTVVSTFGNNLNVANVLEPPLIEIVGEKVFDFEQKGTASFVGDLQIQSPAGITYKTYKLGKDTVSDGTAWVNTISPYGGTRYEIQTAYEAPYSTTLRIEYPGARPSSFSTGSIGILRYIGEPLTGLEWVEKDVVRIISTSYSEMSLRSTVRRKSPLPPQVVTGGLSGFYFLKKILTVTSQQVGAVKDGGMIYISNGVIYFATVVGGSLDQHFQDGLSFGIRRILKFAEPSEDTLGNIRQTGNTKVLSWSKDLLVQVEHGIMYDRMYFGGYELSLRKIFLYDRRNTRITNFSAVDVTHTTSGNGHGSLDIFAGMAGDVYGNLTGADNGKYLAYSDPLSFRDTTTFTCTSSSGIVVGDKVAVYWEDGTTAQTVPPEDVLLPKGHAQWVGSFEVTFVDSGFNQITIKGLQIPDTVPLDYEEETAMQYQGKKAFLYKPSNIARKVNATTLRMSVIGSVNSGYVGKTAFLLNRGADYNSVDMQLTGYYTVTGQGSGYVDFAYTEDIDLTTLQGYQYARLVVPTATNTVLVPCPTGQDVSERLTDLAYPLFSLQSDEAYTSISILRRFAYAINSIEHTKYVVYYGGEMSGGISPYPAGGIQIQFRDWIKRTKTEYDNNRFPAFTILGANYTVYGSIADNITSQKATSWITVRPAVIAYPSRVHWSEKESQLDLEKAIPQFTNKMYQDVYGSEGDRIVSLVPLKEGGIIFKNNSIWNMSLQPAQNGEELLVINRIEAPTGCSQPFNYATANDTIYYISAGSGLYVCDGAKSMPLPINTYLDRHVGVDLHTQYGFCDPYEEMVYIGWNDSAGNTRRFALGFTAGNIVTDDIPFIPKGYAKFGESHILATNTGILMSSPRYSDEGATIKMTVDTPYVSLDPTKHKFFRSVITNTYSDITYTYTQAIYYSYGTSSENLVQQYLVAQDIRVMSAGRQEFGGSLYKYERQGSLIPRNSSIRLKLEEDSGNIFQVQGVSVLFQPTNETRIPQQGARNGKRY